MMILPDDYYLYLLLASNAVLLAIACVALARFERRCRRIEEFWDSPTGTALAESDDEETREQTLATLRVERKIAELQRIVKVMDMKVPRQQPPAEGNASISLPIENAVRMAKSGASIDDLTRNCGLNIGEARLMQKMHGNTRIAGTG